MYCPACGSAVNDQLHYCNRCGERLTRPEIPETKDETRKLIDSLMTTIFLVVMFGLGILVGLTAILLDKNVAHGGVAAIIALWLAAIFGICFMLARQASRLIEIRTRRLERDLDSPRKESYLPPTNPNQLDAHREPARSVVETTTRTLDESKIER